LHFENPAECIRVNLVRVATGEADLFQLIGIGDDDFLRLIPKQPDEGKGGDGRFYQNIGSAVSVR
jgi:hypothetical protein